MTKFYELAERIMKNTPAESVLDNVCDWNDLLLGLKEAKI